METQTLRRDVANLATIASRDLAALWKRVANAAEAREALEDVLPSLVEVYGAAAATVAANWYDDARDKAGVKGRFSAVPADLTASGATELARWGIAPLFAAEPDWDAARSLVEGGLQRRIANGARFTITGSAIADPQADGWQRVGNGSCAFCRMLIGRGAVYSEARADFSSHDHCNCSAVPAWGGLPRPVKPFTPSSRGVSEADKRRAKKWMADHGLT